MNSSSASERFLPVLLLVLVTALTLGPQPVFPQVTSDLERAQILEDRNEYARARKLYQQYLRDHPTSVDAARGAIRTATRTQRWAAGEKALEQLNEIDSESPTTARLGTRFYFRKDAYDTALVWGKRFRKRNNDSWQPFHYLAQIHLRENQLISAREMVESAQLRTDDNPWVLLDKLLLESQSGDVNRALDSAQRLRELSSDPTIYWHMLRALSDQYDVEELAGFFADGGEGFSPVEPPLLKPVDENDYRYWWSRMTYRADDDRAALEALGDPPDSFRSQWLQAHLRADPAERSQAHQRVLDRWPDRLIAQWQQARLVKGMDPLESSRRKKSAEFFYAEFDDNRYLDYAESSLSALLRSLELDPLNEDRQFELARFYRDRGWQKKERTAAERALTLGYTPPSRLVDYLEALGDPDTGPTRSVPRPSIGVHVNLDSPWKGPLDGESVLASMLRQNIFHQPGLQAFREPVQTQSELSALVQGDTLDGGVSINVRKWGEEFSAAVDFHLPSNRIVTREFFADDDMKEWNLLNTTVGNLKNQWPWTGTIYNVTDNGAWVNLGRIHGIDQGDTLTFVAAESAYPTQPAVAEIYEERLRLSFPSPYYRTVVPRGIDVQVPRD